MLAKFQSKVYTHKQYFFIFGSARVEACADAALWVSMKNAGRGTKSAYKFMLIIFFFLFTLLRFFLDNFPWFTRTMFHYDPTFYRLLSYWVFYKF